jgi:hypothetical protein
MAEMHSMRGEKIMKKDALTTLSIRKSARSSLTSLSTSFKNVKVALIRISASADGGPRSRVCARETFLLAPHQH